MNPRCRLVVFVGPTYSGKSTAAKALQSRGYLVVSARRVLIQGLGRASATRDDLIRAGAALERSTAGAWLAREVAAQAKGHRRILVDSARTARQLNGLRQLADKQRWDIRVIYITATKSARRLRFRNVRRGLGRDFETSGWNALTNVRIETQTRTLRADADVIVDTSVLSKRQVEKVVMSFCDIQ